MVLFSARGIISATVHKKNNPSRDLKVSYDTNLVAQGHHGADLLGVDVVSQQLDDGSAVGVDHFLALLLKENN